MHLKFAHHFRHDRFSFQHLTAKNGLAALTSNRMIAMMGWGMIGIFYPIFLYEFFGQSLQIVFLYYAIVYGLRIPLYVFGAKVFSKIGLIPSMIIGQSGTAVALCAFYLIEVGALNIHPYILLGVAVLALAVNATLYWSPFHTDFASMSTKGKRGRQVSIRYAIQRVVSVTAPIISGWIILQHGYEFNFLLGVFIVLSSLIPLAFLKNVHVEYEFGYFETFKKMFSKKFSPMSVSMIAYGAESVAGTVVWPLFLFFVFKGDYLSIGSFAAVIVVISLILELFVGKETDKYSPTKLLKLGTGVYALGWLGKAIVDTVVGVFAASTFHSVGSILLRTPLDTLMYEQAADAGHYIDEYTTIREISLTIGRTSMMLFLVLLTVWFSISSAFLVAALVSVFVLRLAKQTLIED